MTETSTRDPYGIVTTRVRSRWTQALVVVYLATGVWYLSWRCLHTVNYDALYLSIPLLLADLLGFGFFVLFAFNLWCRVRREAPPPVGGLKVDVFITTYNEPHSVLKPTILSALAMDYPHRTFVLDDGRREDVRLLCRDLGVEYLTRADNEGAKAGNVNAALKRTDGEFIAIFDADHAPFKNFLVELLGYFKNPEVALVQAPQAYYNVDSFQHGPLGRGHKPWHEQSVFYDAIMPGKDRNNAAFWCGSSAVVRRSAIEQVGGVNTLTVTEDMHTAMRMHAAGWQTIYHDRELAVGIAPDDLEPFLVQRLRWAQGAMEILRKDNPLRARGLTFAQRISYFTSAAYVVEYLPKAIYLVTPPVVLLTGTLPMSHMGWNLVVRFLPYYLLGLAASQALTYGRNPFLRAERFHLLKIEIMLRALTFLVWPRKLKFKVTSKSVTGANHRFSVLAQIKSQIVIGGLCAAGVVWAISSWLLDAPWALAGLSLVLTSVWAAINAGMVGSLVHSVMKRHHRRENYRFEVGIPLAATIGSRTENVMTSDMSASGVGWISYRWYGVGQRVHLALHPGESSPVIELDATVTACRREFTGFRVGAEFSGIDPETERRVVLMLFQEIAPNRVSAPVAISAETPIAA